MCVFLHLKKISLGAWWEMNLRGPNVDTGKPVRKLQSDPGEMNLRQG